MKCFNLTTANPDLDIAHSAFWHYLADLYILRTLAACWRVVSLLLFLLRPLPGLPSTRQTTFMLQKRVWNVTVLSRSRGEQTGAWQSQGRVGGAAVSLVTHPGHAGHWQVSWSHWTLSNMVIWLGFSLLFKKHQNQKHHRPHTHNSVWGVQCSGQLSGCPAVQCLYITTDYPGDGGGSSDSEYQFQMTLACELGNVLSLAGTGAGTTQWWPGTWNVETHFTSYLHSYRHLSGKPRSAQQ